MRSLAEARRGSLRAARATCARSSSRRCATATSASSRPSSVNREVLGAVARRPRPPVSERRADRDDGAAGTPSPDGRPATSPTSSSPAPAAAEPQPSKRSSHGRSSCSACSCVGGGAAVAVHVATRPTRYTADDRRSTGVTISATSGHDRRRRSSRPMARSTPGEIATAVPAARSSTYASVREDDDGLRGRRARSTS